MTALNRAWFVLLFSCWPVASSSCARFGVYHFSKPLSPGDLPINENARVAGHGDESQRLTAIFLGHSTIAISDGETNLMTDGFFSRPPARRYLFGKISPDTEHIREALEKAKISRPDAIVVAHSHHGHVMDAPCVAEITGAKVIGSRSTASVCEGYGLDPSQIEIVSDSGGDYRVGRFTIRLIESKHGEFPKHLHFLEKKIMGDITEPVEFPAPVSAFKSGPVYSILFEHPLGNILVHPSAAIRDGMMNGRKVDVAFLGVSLLGELPLERKEAIYRELIEKTGAARVIPIHWDDFTKPLSDGVKSTRKTDVPAAMAFLESRASRSSGKTRIIHAPPFEVLTLFASPNQED